MLHRNLAIFGGVADVLRVRAFDVGELSPQRFDDVFSLVEAERCLRQISDAIGIRNA